ncbi:hypothetical protein [Marinospirillum sp.]|uniref:hypothetical protein n=1 Tax=Marinospirillum sp. TaxID=2183934 RepID=UPI00384D701A
MRKIAFTALVSLLALPVHANPPDWRNNQLLLPEKITVGPSDNYQARPDINNQRLFYTRHQSLVSQVVQQNLETGRTRELLPPDHDAKDPALSPDGRRLALTSYRGNALGSVCVLPLQGEDPQLNCLTADGQRAWLPFWVDASTLGYLRRAATGRDQELVLHSLSSGQQQVLLQGQLSAPSVSSDGRYLLFQRRGEQQGLYVYDLENQQETGPLPLDLPGLSSYALYNPEDGYLYFSHFLSDTSGDQQIDGEDHSVIFRIRLERLLESDRPLLPEQLTSVAHNCNFPALGGQQLYMTCAYEGSLDTYRLPLSGQLPEHWQEEDLREADSVASHYAERLLLLNNLRYRQGSTSQAMLEKLLANHLEMGELTAASHFTRQLQERSEEDSVSAHFYSNLQLLLQLKAEKQLQPSGQLTSAYQGQLEQARKALQPSPQAEETAVFRAWINWLGLNTQEARNTLSNSPELPLPLAHYLQIQLDLELAETASQTRQALLAATGNPVIASDARVFYAFQYLQLLSRQALDQQAHIQQLQRVRKNVSDERVLALLDNEISLLQLAAASERSEERALYQTISGRLRDYSDQPQMHRALHIRAIQRMGLAERYDFMELMSRHWLTTTNIRHVGFAAAAGQYATINLNRGYGAWSQEENNTALNTFYSVLRQTSDLEALYNLLRLGLAESSEPALKERMQRLYEQLLAEDLLGNNQLYAEALRPLLTQPNPDMETLQASAEKLQKLEVSGLDSGVRDLLLGYLYHRQLLATQEGYNRDQDLAQQAHHHYMLGLDLAYRNPRVEAAVLENLGQLHFQLGNHGLAAEFLGQRLALPWLNREQQLWLHWRYARALYYSNRYPAASRQAEEALALGQQLEHPETPALQERAAFYALQAQDFPRATEHYESLLNSKRLTGNNAVKAQFSLAYAYFQLDQSEKARKAFTEVLQALPQASPVAARNDRLASFQPQRLEVQSYGFLSRLAATAPQRLEWLEKRLALLQKMHSEDRRYSLDELSRFSLIIQTRLQKAEQLEVLDPVASAEEMRRVLQELANYQEAGGPLGSQPVLQSLYNYLTLGAYHPQAFAQEPQALKELLEATLDELHLELYMPPVNHAQRLKLQLLHRFYQARRQENPEPQALEQQLQELEATEAWQSLALTRPDLLEELNQLATGIRQLTDR